MRNVGDFSWIHLARLWSGVVLFVFVTFHLLNHAVGIFGVEPMETVQGWRAAIWKSWPGSVLLYGSLFTHITLATARVVRRQTWRVPADELWQIISGLSLPFLLAGHILETRIAGSWFGGDEAYHTVLGNLWPGYAWWMTAAVLMAWSHGVIGIHQALRSRLWYRHWRVFGLMLAVIIPCTALAGFVSGGRDATASASAETRAVSPSPTDATTKAANEAGLDEVDDILTKGVYGFLALTGVLIGLSFYRRRKADALTITYRGYGPVSVPRGTSVLEASRMYNIPHPAMCRGRARCASCLVHVTSDIATLPEPFVSERLALNKLGLPANVRLGCQLRPTHDVSLHILMPSQDPRASSFDESTDHQEWGQERMGTVVSLDIRAFTSLTRTRLPYELAILVNRFSSEMTQAVEARGGRIDQMLGDGLVAVFDRDDPNSNARHALRAVRDMVLILESLNKQLSSVLPLPIRAGIGVHTGRLILIRVDDGFHATTPLALGDTAAIATSLQRATKDVLADIVISKETADASRFEFSRQDLQSIMIDGYDAPVEAYAISDRAALQRLVPRTTLQRATEALGMET